MTAKSKIISLILASLLASPAVAKAQTVVTASSLNTTWKKAVSIGDNPLKAELYGRLVGTGDARYYRFRIDQPVSLKVNIVTSAEKNRLEPRLVLYEPEQITVGPALPMSQPPLTLAMVLTANAATIHTEGLMRTRLITRFDRMIKLDQAGQYYLAVYNAGQDQGPFRLSLSTTLVKNSPWMSVLRSWWLTNIWLGPQYGTLTVPLFITAAALIAWLIVSRVPLPVRAKSRSRRSRRTITHGRIS